MEDNKNKKVPNVPTLRFPEFSGEWKLLSFVNLYKIVKINEVINKNQYLKVGNTPIIDQGNELICGYSNQIGCKLPTIVYGDHTTYCKYIDFEFLVGSDGTKSLRSKNDNLFNLHFLYYCLLKNNLASEGYKRHFPILKTKDFYITTNKLEQTKIANFLSLIDKRIELQNKIIKDYKLLKKELNNKLFCQINNSTPKIRFKNFYEKWAKNKVKNIFESVTRGYALSKKDISTIKTNTFKYPVYSSQTLNNGLLGYYSNYLYENAITWTTDGANAGEVNFRKDKFYCTNVCGVLLSNNGYCNECMAAIINKVTKKFVSLVGNPKLMNNVMENIEIIFPSNIKEQLKISIFLSTIDKIIALYKNAINLYKKQKNFFLSKLFI